MDKVIKHEQQHFDDLDNIFDDLLESLEKIKGRKNKNNAVTRLVDINEDITKLINRIQNLLIEINTCYDIVPSDKEEQRKEEDKRFKKLWSNIGPLVACASIITSMQHDEENE
jgi:chromosome segregation ATPase